MVNIVSRVLEGARVERRALCQIYAGDSVAYSAFCIRLGSGMYELGLPHRIQMSSSLLPPQAYFSPEAVERLRPVVEVWDWENESLLHRAYNETPFKDHSYDEDEHREGSKRIAFDRFLEMLSRGSSEDDIDVRGESIYDRTTWRNMGCFREVHQDWYRGGVEDSWQEADSPLHFGLRVVAKLAHKVKAGEGSEKERAFWTQKLSFVNAVSFWSGERTPLFPKIEAISSVLEI